MFLSEAERLANIKPLAIEQSGFFPDGAHIARFDKIPWSPFNLIGSAEGPVFKLMTVNWERDMFVMILDVPGGLKVEPHYHLGEAYGFILSGSFDYEYGKIVANNYIGEGARIAHSAVIGPDSVLQYSILFGGLCGVKPDGSPDLSVIVGCRAVYEMARRNNAADHIAPPPPGWKSQWETPEAIAAVTGEPVAA
jgi:hypothetical protein